ncbi:CD166 antigen homolog A isoform X1 [Pangasianodon hypophthalmus]|uniref:CD166 antigen homolog A isoform X1 n=1 Tax=Pangasianodon hypophthalmus TaxID=310915 RepID=UPI00230776F4|nr:CD166 antigen homolog A isoform X1 [Pangasianodon hypophthalmus]XP_026797557.3 CD166 antigen homolog A isoform X1 [Pangasianodon hypophthalmus]
MRSVFFFGAFFAVAMFPRASSIEKVIALYGDTIKVPCNNGNNKPSDLMFTKWKHSSENGTSGDILVKQEQKDEAKITATDSYKDRASIGPDSSLLISHAVLDDQRVFTCMVVSMSNLKEYPVDVEVHKRPSAPEFRNKASRLDDGKLRPLGECVAASANPPAEIIWVKNNKTLQADNKLIIISASVTKDPVTGLSTTTSQLQYTAGKQDATSKFACVVKHVTGPDQMSAPETFSIHYPTEKVTLQVLSQGSIKEGDNVTLKCQADGNPPPTSFNFYIKGKKVPVTNSDVYTLSGVNRADSGEYKCSLIDNDNMQASTNITVTYLDLNVIPSGSILKKVGESLEVKIEKSSSSEATVTWTKDGGKLDKLPDFSSLAYNHTGFYVCEASVAGIKRRATFKLVVEGIPVIKILRKEKSTDGKAKVLICHGEGSPEPEVSWSVNGTHNQSEYSNGVFTYKLTVVPSANLTVTCRVSNSLGTVSRDIEVLSLFQENKESRKDDEDDKAKVIVGVVVGLIVAAALVGIIYWLYMRSRQGSWKTNEKETGTSEESKKLEENNHRQEP